MMPFQSPRRIAVGILGNLEHGKGTVAKYLVKKYGYFEMSYAFGVRQAIKRMFMDAEYYKEVLGIWGQPLPQHVADALSYYSNVPPEEIDPWEKPTTKPMRTLMQWVGTDVYRERVDPDIWTEKCKREMPILGFVVFSDLRFVNESKILDAIIWVHDPRQEKRDHHHHHKSEMQIQETWDKFNGPKYLILNEAGLDELHRQVDSASFCINQAMRVEDGKLKSSGTAQ